jgi:trk system potassium uptake protein TrkA
VQLVEVPCHVGWVGHAIRSIERELRAAIPALTRYGSAMVVADSTVLQSGDIVYAMVESARIDDVQTTMSAPPLEH